MAEDKFEELHPDDDDIGEPVEYDPFPEDRPAEAVQALEELVKISAETGKSLERLGRSSVSGMDKMSHAINKLAQGMDALADSINARREVVRGEDGKIIATKTVH